MTSTRLPRLLAASARSSPAEQKRAKEDLLAWRAVANMIRSLNEQSKGVTWPPPVASYGTWPREHVAAAMLRVLLTAHGTRTHLVGAQELLQTHHELDRWLSRARLYPVLSTILARFDRQMKSNQPTTFETLKKAEVLALALSVNPIGRELGQAAVSVPRQAKAVVGAVGGSLKLVTGPPEQATAAAAAAVRAMFDGILEGSRLPPHEWRQRVRYVAYLIDSEPVQRLIGTGDGVRAVADEIVAGLVGVSASTVRRRSVDISQLLPSTFSWAQASR